MKYILLLFLSLASASLLKAQQNDSMLSLPSASKPKPKRSIVAQQMDSLDGVELKAKAAAIGDAPAFQQDKRIHEVDVKYYTFVYAQRQKIFSWQLFSAKIILVVVIIVVCMGLFLSWLQFRTYEKMIDLKTKQLAGGTITATKATESAGSEGETFTSTSFEVNKDGMKVNSAVIGLIILTISIVFFFLYLRFVFGINSEAMPQDALNPAAAAVSH